MNELPKDIQALTYPQPQPRINTVMNETEFVDYLDEIISWSSEEDGMVAQTRTFRDVGMLTRNEGLVVKLESGETFQITVVKSS